MGSDGLFEFLSNDEIADILSSNSYIDDAIEDLVLTATKKWVNDSKCSDDITIVLGKF